MTNYNGLKTHCPQGHEYTVANTYINKSTIALGNCRQCKTCIAVRTKTRAALVKSGAVFPKRKAMEEQMRPVRKYYGGGNE